MRHLRVGFLKLDQNWFRNITRHSYPDVRLCRVVTPFRVMKSLYRRLGLPTGFVENTHIPPAFPPVDLLHVWRTVCYGRLPWVVTTSVGLPFGWPQEKWAKALALLASDQCKRIIVNSRHAYRWQERKLERSPQLAERIRAKLEVLHTPQDVLVDRWDKKPVDPNSVVFTIVGHEFFRKGGHHLLNVAARLIQDGAPIQINVVSRLKKDEFGCASDDVLNRVREEISKANYIHWFESLPNDEVLRLLASSHVGVLLSYCEAYGYSVLEAQASGCAMITTDVFALPELNDESTGWVVPVAQEGLDYRSVDDRIKMGEIIESRLLAVMTQILNERDTLRRKGEAAIERIRRRHSPQDHADRLRSIYFDAVRR